MDLKSATIVALIVALSVLGLCPDPASGSERAPVLRQIDVPHDYYFREMYLPQVSSGPQNPVWSPDGQTLVFTMQPGTMIPRHISHSIGVDEI